MTFSQLELSALHPLSAVINREQGSPLSVKTIIDTECIKKYFINGPKYDSHYSNATLNRSIYKQVIAKSNI